MPVKSQDLCYVGLDVGTTSVKACAFAEGGKMLAESIEAYPLNHPEPGAAVQSSLQILASCVLALKKTIAALTTEVGAIGLSCPMHSVLLYHEKNGFADKVYTWADGRGQSILHRITDEEKTELHKYTGTPVHPMSPLVKFRWLVEERPEEVRAATHLYSLKELLTHSWTTRAVLDEQLASATGLYDAVRGEWNALALRTAAGMNEGAFARDGFPLKLPEVRPATHRLQWKAGVARELGVGNVPVFLGGSDGCLANVGSGITKPGQVAITIGTSAAVRSSHGVGRIDPVHKLFNYRIDEKLFAVGGASNNGGKIVEYWQEMLRGHFKDIPAFIEAAFTVEPEHAPRLKPFLYGERAPLWDAGATAQLTGLRGHHGPAHIARAVLDGVTDNVVAILRDLESAVGETEIIEASGGFTRSRRWLDLLEARSGRKVIIADTPQASAYGAALMAKRGLESEVLRSGEQ